MFCPKCIIHDSPTGGELRRLPLAGSPRQYPPYPAGIAAAATALRPYVLPLTPTERHDIPKMGDKTLSFVEKSYEFAEANPSLCPSFINMTEFQVDMRDATGLRVVGNAALQLYEEINDTEMLSGSEAFQASLGFYNNVKLLAAQDVPGAKAVFEELKKRFHRPKRGQAEPD